MADEIVVPVETQKELATKAVLSFLDTVNKSYDGSEVINFCGKFRASQMPRFSSGSISVDLGLGGGWPFGRIVLIAGEESTGKTLLTIKACVEVEKYDHVTHKHKELISPEQFVPGRALFVDVEGTFDLDWAKKHGFNEAWHVITRPETGEQAIDIVTAAIESDLFDLIIVDSLAACTPSKEIEESVEDNQMGLQARLLNKAFRRWPSKLNKISQKTSGVGGPAIICLNQFRLKIGLVFGDPRTLPGGKGQRFAASIIIYTHSTKIDDSGTVSSAYVTFNGEMYKNKTYVPKLLYKFQMALKDLEDEPTGYVDNLSVLISEAREIGLITSEKGKYIFGKSEFSTLKEMKARLSTSEVLCRSLWKSVVKARCGTLV